MSSKIRQAERSTSSDWAASTESLEEAAGAEEEEETFETLLTRVLQRKRRPTGASCTGKPRRRRKVSRSDFKSLMDNH
jgi:hypothetical protein